jgi:hypothetical protein
MLERNAMKSLDLAFQTDHASINMFQSSEYVRELEISDIVDLIEAVIQ